MKKDRMTADNVDQLLEIVRAVQRGEDPAAALEKSKAESARQADSPKSCPEEDSREWKKGQKGQEEEASASEEEDDFERILNEDAQKTRTPVRTAGRMSGGLKKAGDFLRNIVGAASRAEAEPEDADEDEGDGTYPEEDEEQAEFPEKSSKERASEKKRSGEKTSQEKTVQEKAGQGQKNSESKAGGASSERSVPELTAEDFRWPKYPGEAAGTRSGSHTSKDRNSGTETPAEAAGRTNQPDRAEAGRSGRQSPTGGTERTEKRISADETRRSGRQNAAGEARYTEKEASADETRRSGRQNAAGKARYTEKEASADETRRSGRQSSADETGRTEKRTSANETRRSGRRSSVDRETASAKKNKDDFLDDDLEFLDMGEDNTENDGTSGGFGSVLRGLAGRIRREKADAPANRQNQGKDSPAEKNSQRERLSDSKAKKTAGPRAQSVGGALKAFFRERREQLSQKGINNRELAMIGMGLLLAVVIVLLIVNAVRTALEEKKKKEHVTADAGLSVTVENEPEEWCSSWPVELKFRAEGNVITKITVNGTSYQPDSDGLITVETSDYLLEATAVTEKGNLQARIEIPKLDAAEPVVYVQREKNQIVLTAADARSSVRKIWYAVVRGTDWLTLPYYQEYNGSIPYEEGAVYYFYAQDAAGNSSRPIVTTMEQAESLELESGEISLYPDEERRLTINETPKGALLNNLRIESTNPEIVSVDNSGMMKAQKEGSATIRVNADGVEQAACTVTVSKSRTVTISTIGDCTLGTDEAFNTTTSLNAYETMYGSEWFFGNVKAILENDDITFANFEGTLTTETAREQKEYAFKGDPSYTDILRDGSVEVVTLANNHSSDYGAQSLEDTKQYLSEADIDYCTGDTIVVREVNGIRTAFIGIYVLNDGMARESQVRETIAAAKEQGAQLVIIAFHWGSERETQPDATQRSLAHTAVDCGADLVVGHHPHVLQGIEKYNGKYIVYSLANFCFGGNSAPSDMDTMIFRQTFTISEGKVLDDDQIEIIPCRVSSAEGYNNYQPTPAEGSEADRILGRVNEYSQEFGQTYTASSGLD